MRKIFILPLILALFAGATLFASCEEERGKNPPADETSQKTCAHELFDAEIVLEPTCKEEGEKKLTCRACGFEKTEKIPKIDHILSERRETLPATCENKGESAQICTMCEEKFSVEVLPALGHSMKEYTVTPATCSKEGERILKCERCEKTEREVLPLTEHEWEDVEELKKPTCEKEGLTSAVCKVCGKETDQRAIPALGHDFKETLHEDATCERDGKVERACTRCDQKETEVLPALGHSFEDKILEQPTCTKDGRVVPVCKTCGAQGEERIISSTGHSFSDWEEVLPPTCVSNGREERTCSVCGEKEEKKISLLGHHFSNDFIVDKYPTKEEEGEESRHCLNPGCNERRDIHKIDKLEDKTDYSVTLTRTSGEGFKFADLALISIRNAAGESKGATYGNISSLNLPTDTYTVTVENLPKGFKILEKEYTLTPENPDLKIVVYSEIINEDAPMTTTEYDLGDVIYDQKVNVVELEKENDHQEYLSGLFAGHKAIVINMYFKTCPYCIMEMPDLVNAYKATAPSGKTYGEEVAVLLLDYGETEEAVRQMKHQSNYYLPEYQAVYNVPITTIHDGWLTRYFSKKLAVSFPTTLLIDSEGVIVEKHAGAMSEDGFKSLMDRGIERYNKSEEWKRKEGIASSAPQNIIPAKVEYVSRKKERYE